MSFCPSRDVHSLYIDNELPQKYVAEYDAHVKNCPDCQRQLNSMKKIHEILKTDAENSSPERIYNSENYMDESYKRLMIKMAYNKNTKVGSNNFNLNLKKRLIESIHYTIPAAVAAAVVAIILPARFLGVNNQTTESGEGAAAVAQASVNSQLGPVGNIPVATPVSFNNDRGVVISGNIHESVLPVSDTDNNFVASADKIKAKKTDKNKSLINEYEVFRPAFSDEKTISIRITVPGIDTNPVTTEIELPYDVFTGYFE